MKKRKLSLGILICIFISVVMSCEKDDFELDNTIDPQVISKVDTTLDVYQKIIESGFSTNGIEDIGEYYLVEGDILFSKDYVNEGKLKRTKQARTKYLIPWDKQPNITVRIDASIPSSGSDNWRTEIQQALNDWNNINNCRINFTLITNTSADITIRSDGNVLPNYALAAAEFPIYGQPGFQVRINLDFYYNMTMSSAQKRYNMVHELGHCIGFRHTNWLGLGEGSGGLYNIPGTPTIGNNPDPNSVMNGGTALNSWNGFSTHDINAAQYLFGRGRRVVLKTWNGYYLQAVNGGGGDAIANSANPWEWETFHLMESPLWGHPYYVLQTIDGGYYLQAINGGGGNVVATSLNPWEWETFELIASPYYTGKYVLKTKKTGHYLQAVNGGGANLVANSPNPWAWESFEILNSWF